MKRSRSLKDLVLAAVFMAIGFVLPFLTGHIPQIGNMLLPMHLPVFLCGLICGWQYGLAVGFILPLIRSLVFGMPPMYPTAIAMAFELATYGVVAGWLYGRSRWQCVLALYKALIAAMVAGRLVWAAARAIMSGASGSAFTWEMFLSGAITTAIPGIILQLVLIPAIMVALDKAGVVRFHRTENAQKASA